MSREILLWFPILAAIILMIVMGTTSELQSSSGIISEQFRVLYPSEGTRLSTVLHYVSDFTTVFVQKLTVYNVMLAIILALVTYIIHRELFHPYQLVRNFGDAGYITDGRNKKEVANEIRKRRRAGDVPPVYPNGWFSLLRSWELKTGEVKYVSALGKCFSFLVLIEIISMLARCFFRILLQVNMNVQQSADHRPGMHLIRHD